MPRPGASGFFIPGLTDLALVERIVKASPLPVNAMTWAVAPTREQWASAGIARISYGPGPFRQMQKWLEDAARAEFA
jgi:2-methylisocitrate lyase-like PEP mutase family enzyme